jgi:hypothetical protein
MFDCYDKPILKISFKSIYKNTPSNLNMRGSNILFSLTLALNLPSCPWIVITF